MVKQLETKYKNTKVYFRILPQEKLCWEHVKILDDKKTIFVRCLQDFLIGNEQCKPSFWRFETDGLFYNNTQNEIYEAIVPPVLESVIDGHNAIFLCYGQTGSGKSLTISGMENSYEDRGFIPRIVTELFKIKEHMRSKLKMCLQMSYVEATKMHLVDLFKRDNNLYDINSIKNISAIKMENEEQSLKGIFKAEGRKSFIQGASYNSHAATGVFTVTILTKSLNQTVPVKTISKIHLVDLAGVDTIGNLPSIYKNAFEVGTGNLAKTQLEQFLLILIENIPEHILINQRLNILIQYIKDSLNTHSIFRFVGHIRTDKEDLMMSLSMLRFGQILRGLKTTKLQMDIHENEDAKIVLLEKELNQIRKDVDLSSMILNNDLNTNITQDRLMHVRNVAEEYLCDKVDELVVTTVCDINIILKVFKNMYNKLETETTDLTQAVYKKAYDDAMEAFKGTFSKKDSISSKSSRKASLKSNESKTSGQFSKSSKKSLTKQSAQLSTISETKSKSQKSAPKLSKTEITGSLKRSRTSSKGLRKLSGSRRKSSITSDLLKDKLLDEGMEISMPVDVPTHDEAWKHFTEDMNYQYEKMNDELLSYEEKAKELNVVYLIEVRKLQDIYNLLDIEKDELLNGQLQRESLTQETIDESGSVILSPQEIECHRNINELRNNIVEQQEKVLTLQTELKLYLQCHQDTKRSINEKFEEFCSCNYKTLIPNLDSDISDMKDILYTEPSSNTIAKSSKQLIDEDNEDIEQKNEIMKYELFKKLMNKQKENQLRKEILNKKWI